MCLALIKLDLRSWQANSHTSVSFEVPDNWQAGRIWVRLQTLSTLRFVTANYRDDVIAISRPTPDLTLVSMVVATAVLSVILTRVLYVAKTFEFEISLTVLFCRESPLLLSLNLHCPGLTT
jgi:hypothetical protein